MPKLTLFTNNPNEEAFQKDPKAWRVTSSGGHFIDAIKAKHVSPFSELTPYVATVEIYGIANNGRGYALIACNQEGQPIRPHNIFQHNDKKTGKVKRITAFFQLPALWECKASFIGDSELLTFTFYDVSEFKLLNESGESEGMIHLQQHAEKHHLAIPEVPASQESWAVIEHILFKTKPFLLEKDFHKKGPENSKEITEILKKKLTASGKTNILYADLSAWEKCKEKKCGLYIKSGHTCPCLKQSIETL